MATSDRSEDEFKTKTIELHEEISRCRKVSVEHTEISLERYLMNTFHVGEFFFWVYYLPEQEIEFCSKDVRHILGISEDDFNLNYIVENIHPEDRDRFVNNEKSLIPVLRSIAPDKLPLYKVRYDFRMKDREGNYKHFLHQVITLQADSDGSIIRTFGVYTDITYLNSDGNLGLSLIGLDGEPSYFNIKEDGSYTLADNQLSAREREVLAAIAKGRTSAQIAEELGISKSTVDNHRKRVLEKTGAKSTTEVVREAFLQGVI